MSSAIQPTNPLQNLSCCTLLHQGEFIEIANRIRSAVVDALRALAVMALDCVIWTSDCIQECFGCNKLTPEAFAELERYQNLPISSPKFEQGAIELAKKWITPEEVDDIKSIMDVELFSKIVVRAAMLSGQCPLYFKNGRVCSSRPFGIFDLKCKLLHSQFNELSVTDKTAFLNHLDSEITQTVKEGCILSTTEYCLTSPERAKNRTYVPTPSVITESGKEVWAKYLELANEGIMMNHPIVQGLNHLQDS